MQRFWAIALAVCATAMAGCAHLPHEPPHIPQVDPFLGTWTYTEGAATVSCSNQALTQAQKGLVQFRSAGGSRLVMRNSDGCGLMFRVHGNKAVVEKKQSCDVVANDGIQRITLRPTVGHFEIKSHGTLIEDMNFDARVVTDERAKSCAVMVSAKLKRK